MSSSNNEQCIFCDIAAGYKPAKTVYEDGEVMAFLDRSPVAPGHTLLIPKRHHERITDEDMTTHALWDTVQMLTRRMERAFQTDSTTVAIQNGRDAGQAVNHVHIHIIPRTKGDGGGTIGDIFNKTRVPEDEMMRIQEALKSP